MWYKRRCRRPVLCTSIARGSLPLRSTDDESEPGMTASWRQRAACRGVDPSIFYPISDEAADEAKAICASCAVRQSCIEYALAAREREGVWGGLTERERRRIVRQRRKSA